MTIWQPNDDVRRDGGGEVAEFVDAPTDVDARDEEAGALDDDDNEPAEQDGDDDDEVSSERRGNLPGSP